MRQSYWAVRPISTRDTGENTRIEKAETMQDACIRAFGRGLPMRRSAPAFEAKNLGTRLAVIQSYNKRIALLRDPKNWIPVTGY
jgi:hypothetical protein